ncbi:unnamed protein product [Strongylus vulgaris]|uniref:Homeobox domain-containing protein n=1 Tax=Strongylus vulgaris TaxID=40348 RepID=A0A3P7LCN5_STRVU|nr:unnamed protein product [Strongylus vulgaris]
MSMLDPRQFLMPAFCLDSATTSILSQQPSQNSGGGKLTHSFRISDLLESSSDKSEQVVDKVNQTVPPVNLGTHPAMLRTIQTGDFEQFARIRVENDDLPLFKVSLLEHSTTSRPETPESGCSQVRSSPNDTSPLGSKKARKARTIFTDKQLQELESTFEKQKYLSVQDRMDLAQRMGLTDTQVKTWYQNRRFVLFRLIHIYITAYSYMHDFGLQCTLLFLPAPSHVFNARNLHYDLVSNILKRHQNAFRGPVALIQMIKLAACVLLFLRLLLAQSIACVVLGDAPPSGGYGMNAAFIPTTGMELLNEAGNLAAVQNLLRSNPYWAGYVGQLGGFPTPLPLMMGLPLSAALPSVPPSLSFVLPPSTHVVPSKETTSVDTETTDAN